MVINIILEKTIIIIDILKNIFYINGKFVYLYELIRFLLENVYIDNSFF
jgi:hypothetical protein